MRHYNKNINNNMVNILAKRVLNGIDSILVDYSFLFNEEELRLLVSSRELLRNSLENEEKEVLRQISLLEDALKPLSFRCWEYEADNGSDYISWLKDGNYRSGVSVISSTFSSDTKNTFCDSEIGIKLQINIDAFIAACEKDAASLREKNDKSSLYTVRELPNGDVINSYNLATPIITPMQISQFNENEYISKHNEIILDGRFVKPIGVVCLSDTYKDVAESLSEKLNVPIEFKHKLK